jgi:hypothetical protein
VDPGLVRPLSRRMMPSKTAAASAICGTHDGLTKAETSMTGTPVAESLSTKAILSAVETGVASF